MNHSRCLGLLLAPLLGACGGNAPSTDDAALSLGARDLAPLCLASAPELALGNVDLAGVQARLRQREGDAAAWVAVGRAWAKLARLSLDGGYYVNVDACARGALALDAEAGDAHELALMVLLNGHRFEEAREAASALLEREPEHGVVLGLLGDALLELGDYAGAARAVARQQAVLPGALPSARESYLDWLHGRVEPAKRRVRDALRGCDPNDREAQAWLWTEAAHLYWHEGDAGGADMLYRQALRTLPDYPAALLGRARAALARAERDDARQLATRAHVRRPAIETAALLGDIAGLDGDTVARERWYREAQQLGARGDHLGLAVFLAARDRDPVRALTLARAERASRQGIYVHDAEAWALYRLGRHDAALAASDAALALGTRDARLLYHAGAIRLALGRRDEGVALIERALALNAGFDPLAAAEARALLNGSPVAMAEAASAGADAAEAAGVAP